MKFLQVWSSVSLRLFVFFSLKDVAGLCWPRGYLVCLLLQTSCRGPGCTWPGAGQTRSSCDLLFYYKYRNKWLGSLPSNMSKMFPCIFSFSIIFSKPALGECPPFASILAFGGATCGLALESGLLKASEDCILVGIGQIQTTGTISWCFCRITSEAKESSGIFRKNSSGTRRGDDTNGCRPAAQPRRSGWPSAQKDCVYMCVLWI